MNKAAESLHNTGLIHHVDDKYRIDERVVKLEKKDKLLLSGSKTYLFQLTRTWDKGSRVVRERILREFISAMTNATGPQLEKELDNGASLFLTRISAWLRLTYLLGQDLVLQLKAVTVFVSAASGNRFLTEFLEVGGILTVLEIVTIPQAKEADRAEALKLLTKVAANGRKYKEFICESYGVRQVTECLSKSKNEISQDHARNLLVSLGTGNPKFQMQVFKGLQSLVSSSAVAPTSQQMAAQALRTLLITAETFPPGLIEASATLLRSQHIQVQYEGYELLRELIQRPSCQDTIIILLVTILRNVFEPVLEDPERHRGKDAKPASVAKWTGLAIEDQKEKERVLSGFIQQSYASKLIGVLIASSDELAEKLIKHQLVSALLNVIANVDHPESQKYATNNVLHLVARFEYVAAALRKNMGDNFFDLIDNKPDTFFRELTKEQIRYLRRNNITIRNAESGKDDEPDSGSDSDDETKKKTTAAFPGAYKKEVEVEKVEIAAKPQQQAKDDDLKLQQQMILDSYEQTASTQPKKVVEDVYTQYQQTGVNATFSGNKYSANGPHVERMQFESELENFRSKNVQKTDFKKSFEPVFTEETKNRMTELRTDNLLFSQEKIIRDIDIHLDIKRRVSLDTDDQAAVMLIMEQKFADDQRSTTASQDLSPAPSLPDPTTSTSEEESQLTKEIALALSMVNDVDKADDWFIKVGNEVVQIDDRPEVLDRDAQGLDLVDEVGDVEEVVIVGEVVETVRPKSVPDVPVE